MKSSVVDVPSRAPPGGKAHAPVATSVLRPPGGSAGGGQSSGRQAYSPPQPPPGSAAGIGRATIFTERAGSRSPPSRARQANTRTPPRPVIPAPPPPPAGGTPRPSATPRTPAAPA